MATSEQHWLSGLISVELWIGHATETALVTLIDNLCHVLYMGFIFVLVAFHTVGQCTFLYCLAGMGIGGTVL